MNEKKHGYHTDHKANPSWQRIASSWVIWAILAMYMMRNIINVYNDGSDFKKWEFITLACLLFSKLVSKFLELRAGSSKKTEVVNNNVA